MTFYFSCLIIGVPGEYTGVHQRHCGMVPLSTVVAQAVLQKGVEATLVLQPENLNICIKDNICDHL